MGSGEVVVLVTGSGSSATPSTLYSLRRNPEGRRVRVVCTDIRDGVAARFMCDAFYRVPRAGDPGFIEAVLEIAGREGVGVVLPQAPAELPVFAAARERLRREGVAVAVSRPEAVATALDKYRMLRAAERLGVPVPRARLVHGWDELVEAAEELGYPDEPFVVRVGSGDGMRGFRVVVPPGRAREWFRGERPGGAPWTTLSGLMEVLGGGRFDAPVMVVEYLPGVEYTVDVLAGDAGGGYRVYAVVPRRRLEMRISMTWVGVVEERRDVMEYSARLAEGLGLEYAFGFQFRLDGEGGAPAAGVQPPDTEHYGSLRLRGRRRGLGRGEARPGRGARGLPHQVGHGAPPLLGRPGRLPG